MQHVWLWPFASAHAYVRQCVCVCVCVSDCDCFTGAPTNLVKEGGHQEYGGLGEQLVHTSAQHGLVKVAVEETTNTHSSN